MKGISELEAMFRKQHEEYQAALDDRGIKCEGHDILHLPDEECRHCMEESEKNNRLTLLRTRAGLPARYHGMTIKGYRAETDGQKKAVSASKRLFNGDIRGLIFSGGCGTGKTHLAVAMIDAWLGDFSVSTQYTTTSKMIRSIKDTWGKNGNGKTEQSVIDMWSKFDYLVIDEIGATWGSDAEQLLISEIMCERYSLNKRTVLISNLNKDELKESFDERVWDRLRQDAVLVVFDWESERCK